jgi:hypothetical protein
MDIISVGDFTQDCPIVLNTNTINIVLVIEMCSFVQLFLGSREEAVTHSLSLENAPRRGRVAGSNPALRANLLGDRLKVGPRILIPCI